MSATLLTVDVGNTAAKLRAWALEGRDVLRCTAVAEVASIDPNAASLELFFERTPLVDRAALSSVVGPAATADWLRRLAAHARAPVAAGLHPGIRNATREPERVGPDRLFAARGALELVGESCIVVAVGTALTVDAVRTQAADVDELDWREGEFQGGAIAPGPYLLARAMATGAARLFEVAPEPDPPALGRDSASAMLSGIGIGLRGAARELAAEVAREAGLADPPIALTGGARKFVARAFAGRRVSECADLVHLGLCAALLAHGGHRRPSRFGDA